MHPPNVEPVPNALPFSGWWPVVAGALLGIGLRLVFSAKPGSPFSAMDLSFIYFVPMAVGAVTVFVAERKMRRRWSYYFFAPALASLLFVAGTMIILIEGIICAIIIAPLFAVLGGIGGLAMGIVCRTTNWPRHAAYSFVGLPLMVAFLMPPGKAEHQVFMTERHIVISAEPGAIWKHLLNARDIQPEEVGQAWMYRIGVPLPKAGIAEATPAGLVRHVTMGKEIHFDQVAESWRTDRYVCWHYRFAPDSFPPRALDDHVRIGGDYFDLIDTEYELTPVNQRSTRLTIRMHYRVSTAFNWYALPVARLLIGNFEEVILRFYSRRTISGLVSAA